ncbi:hypothetical protein [Streptosporangium lutulentum]|uniref:Uncharacterized protein n=1 Tax=Streptosporangium lutulentum TaxID=1461250 RepID=A0ABT9QR29_9ACTN|nr:hypothetical protein [Streptosporangium lutulentum]MDP9849209.1 hypothetical protein [Streptosporangium lutulentum]
MEDGEDVEDEERGFVEICVTKKARVRVNYRGCDDAQSGVVWYFLPLSARAPATGSKAKRGSLKQPPGSSYRVPAKGGIGSEVRITDVEDRVKVCVFKSTRIRFSDIRCDDGEKGYDWYYIRIDGYVPGVGKKAEDGSFQTPYADPYSARRNGGDATKAAIGYEDPNMPEVEEEEEEEYCTTTIDGECVSTNRCTRTVNSVCVENENGSLGSSSSRCSNVFANKRWTRRC